MLNITNRIAYLAMQLDPVRLVHPINEAKAYKCYLNDLGSCYRLNPVFIYSKNKLKRASKHETELRVLRGHVVRDINSVSILNQDLEIQNAITGNIILRRIDEAIDTCQIAKAILDEDNYACSKIITRKYGTPNSKTIISAYDLANLPQPAPTETIPTIDKYPELKDLLQQRHFYPIDIINVFNDALIYYGFDNWHAIPDDHVQEITVNIKNGIYDHTISIPTAPDYTIDGLMLLYLIGRHIEIQVRSIENSFSFWQNILTPDYSPLAILLAKSDDELLYQGFSNLTTSLFATNANDLSHYYTVAIDQAMRGHSLREVTDTIITLLDEAYHYPTEIAITTGWRIAHRIFFGCTDNSNPEGYAFMHENAYFAVHALSKLPHYLDFASMSKRDLDELRGTNFELNVTHTDRQLRFHPEKINLL